MSKRLNDSAKIALLLLLRPPHSITSLQIQLRCHWLHSTSLPTTSSPGRLRSVRISSQTRLRPKLTCCPDDRASLPVGEATDNNEIIRSPRKVVANVCCAGLGERASRRDRPRKVTGRRSWQAISASIALAHPGPSCHLLAGGKGEFSLASSLLARPSFELHSISLALLF